MLDVFEGAFLEVRKYLLTKGFSETHTIQQNPHKDDVTKGFDYRAEEIAIEYFQKNLPFPVRILSEERGEINPKEGEPKYTLVIDPVDGSTNFARQIECCAFAVSATPAKKAITLKDIEYAFVGSIFTGNKFCAQKGKGTTYNGKKVQTSKVTRLDEACLSVDLDYRNHPKNKKVWNALEKAAHFRRGGAAALDSAYVSNGAYDAYLDARDINTAENFLTTCLLVTEAGGVFSDAHGKEITQINGLDETFSWVASANKALHREVLDALQWK